MKKQRKGKNSGGGIASVAELPKHLGSHFSTFHGRCWRVGERGHRGEREGGTLGEGGGRSRYFWPQNCQNILKMRTQYFYTAASKGTARPVSHYTSQTNTYWGLVGRIIRTDKLTCLQRYTHVQHSTLKYLHATHVHTCATLHTTVLTCHTSTHIEHV